MGIRTKIIRGSLVLMIIATMMVAPALAQDKPVVGLVMKSLANEFDNAVQTAKAFLEREKYDEAILEFEKALKINPGDKDITAALENTRRQKETADDYAALVREGDNLYIEKQFTEFTAFNRADTMNIQQTVTGLGEKNGHLNQGFI